MTTPDLQGLSRYFDPEDIEWRPIAVSKRTGKAMAAAYVTNRAIMDRLDDVVGPANWRNEYTPGPDGGVLCGLSINVGGEWVTKWDGAENTEIHAVKGGLSSSMRRAAVQWGIGRYLYKFPAIWVPVDEHGRFTEEPQVPQVFLPTRKPWGAALCNHYSLDPELAHYFNLLGPSEEAEDNASKSVHYVLRKLGSDVEAASNFFKDMAGSGAKLTANNVKARIKSYEVLPG